MCKVTVIIPAYNNSKYIKSTIESILSQTHQNTEIIVVDDGSTDHTAEIVKSYGKRIKYFYQKNQGAAVARNRGFKEATGEMISFLDSDDTWDKENLELKLNILNLRDDVGAVFSDFRLMTNKGVFCERGMRQLYPIFTKRNANIKRIFESRTTIPHAKKLEIDFYSGKIFYTLLFGNFINLCSIVMRRRVQKKIGFFRPSLITQQDYDYWLRLSREYAIGYIDEPLVNYRRHDTQLTASNHHQRILRTVVGILEPYYKERNNLLPKKLIPQFAQRYAECYRQLGLAYLGKRKNRLSRKAFGSGLKILGSNIPLRFLWLFSFLPPAITNDFTSLLLSLKGHIKRR